MHICVCICMYVYIYVYIGGFNPSLKNMKVSWDDYSQSMGK